MKTNADQIILNIKFSIIYSIASGVFFAVAVMFTLNSEWINALIFFITFLVNAYPAYLIFSIAKKDIFRSLDK